MEFTKPQQIAIVLGVIALSFAITAGYTMYILAVGVLAFIFWICYKMYMKDNPTG